MGETYQPKTKVDWTSNNAYTQFKLWRKEVERIIDGPLEAKGNPVKINHIYIWAGAHAEQLIDASKSEDADLELDTPKKLLDQLAKCITHTTFYREARENFYGIKQKNGENTTTYYSRIMDLYKQAEFPADTDFLVIDKLIHGCFNPECKRKLMGKTLTDLSVKVCLDTFRKYESVDVTMKRLGDSPSTVNASYSRDPTKRSQRNGDRRKSKHKSSKPMSKSSDRKADDKKCTYCARESHPRSECPAKDATCRYCKNRGHFDKACIKKRKSKNYKQRVVEADPDSSDYEHSDFDLASVKIGAVDKKSPREVLAEVEFITTDLHTLEGKVDTGAMVSCMPLSMLQDIGLSKKDLKPSQDTLHGVSGVSLKNLGTIELDVVCNNKRKKENFYITELGNELILGLGFSKRFKLVEIASTCVQRRITAHSDSVNAVSITDESEADYDALKAKWKKHLPLGKKTGDPLEDLKLIFPTTFDGGVGLFEGEADLKLSPGAVPVQLPPRNVPLSVLPNLKKELDKMEKEGIIRPCPETTEWVHNLVIAVKKNGDLRICLDPKNLNKYLIRNIHYTASWEDAQHSFKNGKYFSTLDVKSGFWTKLLSKRSQLLTAFNTPFKKYCFIRMPFGLSISSEVFCQHMDQAVQGIPGTFPCADDVKIQGSTSERHDLHILETVERAKKAGLKFNPNKCFVKKERIEYFGRYITPDGVKPCPKKVKAISNLVAPTDKLELHSFMGTVTFLKDYIPNLSKKTHHMRGLLQKDVHYVWTSDMQAEFEDLKNIIAAAVSLIHFDPNKPAVIETDASMKGLGAVLLQDGRPVKFLSKSLSKTEKDYANIERELLAVLFACEKLKTYTFGRKTTVHTDHKPLESIFKKPISLAPDRLQRMLRRLIKFDLDVKYVGAKKVLLADTLSRLVRIDREEKDIPGLDVQIAQVMKIKPTRLTHLQEETKADATLMELKELIITGWPTSMQDTPTSVHPFWCFRDELTILDGLIMKGNRIVVPTSMRKETLKRLHDAHQGLSSTLQRARRTVYWPKMQDDITQLIEACEPCQVHARKKPRAPERQISASRPMQILGMDLMEFRRQTFLVIIDYYSGYITYSCLPDQTADSVITQLGTHFRNFGLAEQIISDNGPCFSATSFSNFCAKLEIKHLASSPHYHESNGRAERAIYTLKQVLKKATDETEAIVALAAYHDTPVSDNLPCPAELFFGRRINTRLSFIHPKPLPDYQKSQLADRRAAHLKK